MDLKVSNVVLAAKAVAMDFGLEPDNIGAKLTPNDYNHKITLVYNYNGEIIQQERFIHNEIDFDLSMTVINMVEQLAHAVSVKAHAPKFENTYWVKDDDGFGGDPQDIWVDKEGRSHHIATMSNSHLINTIKYLETNCKKVLYGIMGSDIDQRQLLLCTVTNYPIYVKMVREALDRNFGATTKSSLNERWELIVDIGADQDFDPENWLDEETDISHFDKLEVLAKMSQTIKKNRWKSPEEYVPIPIKKPKRIIDLD